MWSAVEGRAQARWMSTSTPDPGPGPGPVGSRPSPQRPTAPGLPAEEGVDLVDVERRLDEAPGDAVNRTDRDDARDEGSASPS